LQIAEQKEMSREMDSQVILRNCVLLTVIFMALTGFAGGNGKDTTRAVVVYNLDVLDITEEGHSQHFISLVDSVRDMEQVDSEMRRLIDVTASIHKKSEEELVILIDSLFALKEIPYALINEINYQIARDEFQRKIGGDIFKIPEDGSPYPANALYGTWSTTSVNPYPRSISAQDSTYKLLLTDMDEEYVHPVDNIVTSPFGWRGGRNHNGYDLDLEVWDPVKTAFGGVVRFASWGGGFGRLVIVRHDNGLETFYAHLHRYKVKAGDRVKAGDVIGLGGSSGHSTGSHLHFEVRFKGIPLDPGQIIDFRKQTLRNEVVVLKKTRWSYAVFPEGTIFHEVKSGDYLHKIAQTYGTTIDELCQMNNIRRNDYLRLGQRLKVGSE
jgi:murein DD-endopeptidase MepM/ murein hydrolase activator NlpD